MWKQSLPVHHAMLNVTGAVAGVLDGRVYRPTAINRILCSILCITAARPRCLRAAGSLAVTTDLMSGLKRLVSTVRCYSQGCETERCNFLVVPGALSRRCQDLLYNTDCKAAHQRAYRTLPQVPRQKPGQALPIGPFIDITCLSVVATLLQLHLSSTRGL